MLTMDALVYGAHVLVFLGTAQAWATAAASCVLGAAMISASRCMRWTIVGHHGSRGGLGQLGESSPGVLTPQSRRGVLGEGFRRVLDGMDKMVPEAWSVDSQRGHCLPEEDPDLAERNLELLQRLQIPKARKYLIWVFARKPLYSPSTFRELQTRIWSVFAVVLLGVVPMACMIALPVVPALSAGAWPFAAAAAQASLRTLGAALLAELFTSAHSVITACTHAEGYGTCGAYGAEWLLRCALSANVETGSNLVGLCGWLNGAEHRSPVARQCRRLPLVSSLCQKHGVLYEQNALKHTRAMFRAAVGARMRRCTALIPAVRGKQQEYGSPASHHWALPGG